VERPNSYKRIGSLFKVNTCKEGTIDMTSQHIIRILVLILLFVTSNCRGIGKGGVAPNSIKGMNKFEETKNNNTQKQQLIENASKLSAADSCKDINDVSIIQLISNPEKFDGKCVRLIGFVHLEFEGDAMYLHEVDYENRLTKNGLWLEISEDFYGKDKQKYTHKYVLVEGIFSANNEGYMNLFSGAIENIKRFEVWPVINGRVIPGSVLDR
jgi:hypothetical protein